MSLLEDYLVRRAAFPTGIVEQVHPNLNIIVVIPCHNEPQLIRSLEALWRCDRPNCAVEVITVLNASEKAEESILEENKRCLTKAQEWAVQHQDDQFRFYFLEHNNLKAKFAGVGWARKIGMDEAVQRFDQLKNDRGIIVCFDADSQCDPNYLQVIHQHFQKNDQSPGAAIYFEHPLNGEEFDPEVYQGIVSYELFLRYYRQGLRWAGHPFAYHTVGSSMAVRAGAYVHVNGMNRRKAGEDFYFLQKVIPMGHFTEINGTCVIPSPRPSDRVPFGTGKAIAAWLDSEKGFLLGYDPQSFKAIQQFLELIPDFYENRLDGVAKLPESMRAFLEEVKLESELKEIHQYSTGFITFQKRFYQWFNAFLCLKFTHFARDHFYPDLEIKDAAAQLLSWMKEGENYHNKSPKDLLLIYRQLEREGRAVPQP